MNNNRFCTQKGHEQIQTTHLCLFEDCRLLQRSCCIYCINEGIHNHGKADQEHIKLDQVIKKFNNKNIKPIDFSKRRYKVQEIDSGHMYSPAHISNGEKYLAYGGWCILEIYDLKKDKIIKEFKNNGQIQACQFSSDSSQLYVAFGNDDRNYYDYDKAKFNKIIGYDVKKNFKKIFQYYVLNHYWQITESIITIQNQYLITCSCNKIIKIDIKRNKQIFKLIDDISTIDYNQQYDVIITGNNRGSVKLCYFGKRITIINQEEAHQYTIYQIQFINNIQNVLSLDYGSNLYKWSVDLINKKLIKLQEYQDPKGIYSFSSINQNQNLLLICGCCVKIVDDKGQTIKLIDYQCGDHFLPSCQKNRQLDNAKYICVHYGSLILNTKKIILLSALE